MDGSNEVYIKQISYPPKTKKSSTTGYVLELGDYKYLHLKAHTVNDFFGVFPIHYKDTSGTWHILNAQKDGVVIGYAMALKVSDTKCKVLCAPNHEIFVKNMLDDGLGFFSELEDKFPDIEPVISTYIEPSTKEGRLIALTGNTKNDDDKWGPHLHIAKIVNKSYKNPLDIIPHVDWIAPTLTVNYPLNGSLVQAGVDLTFDVHVDDKTSRNLNNIKFTLKKGTTTQNIMEWSFDPESPSDLKKMTYTGNNEDPDRLKYKLAILPELGKSWKKTFRFTLSKYEVDEGDYTFTVETKGIKNSSANTATASVNFRVAKGVKYRGNFGDTYSKVRVKDASDNTITDYYLEEFLARAVTGVTNGLFGPGYIEGYKAIAIALYDLLLHEVSLKHNGYDILVNGTTDNQPYNILFNNSQYQNFNPAITQAVSSIYYVDGSGHYVCQAFWPNQYDSIKRSLIDGDAPKLRAVVFPYVAGSGINNIIQSSKKEIGLYDRYLNESLNIDEANGVSTLGFDQTQFTKVGMSAWGAMTMGQNNSQGKPMYNALQILNKFYRLPTIICDEVKLYQPDKTDESNLKYSAVWGKATADGLRIPLRDKNERIDTGKDMVGYLYFSQKASEIKVFLKGGRLTAEVPINGENSIRRLQESELNGRPDGVEIKIPSDTLINAFGTEYSSEAVKDSNVVIAIYARDEKTGMPIDERPGSIDNLSSVIFDSSLYHCDETNILNGGAEPTHDPANTKYYGVTVDINKAVTLTGVEYPVPPFGNFTVPIPRLDLTNIVFGFSGSGNGIMFIPSKPWSSLFGSFSGQFGTAVDNFKKSLGGKGISAPTIDVAPVKPDEGIDAMVKALGEVNPCNVLGGNSTGIMDQFLNAMGTQTFTNSNGQNVTRTGKLKIFAQEGAANAALTYLASDQISDAALDRVAGVVAQSAFIAGMDLGPINELVSNKELSETVSIGMAVIGAVNVVINPAYAAQLASGVFAYLKAWAEAMVKAKAFEALDVVLANNKDALKSIVKNLPGSDELIAEIDAMSSEKMFNSMFNCPPSGDLSNLDWDQLWENTGDELKKLLIYIGEQQTKEFFKAGLGEGTLKNLENVAGKVGNFVLKASAGSDEVPPVTMNQKALKTVEMIMSQLPPIPDPTLSAIVSIIPMLAAIVMAEPGNMMQTADEQLGLVEGKARGYIKDLENKGKAQLKSVVMSSLPQVPMPDWLKFEYIPFVGEAMDMMLGGLSFADGMSLDLPGMLKDIAPAGELQVIYPFRPESKGAENYMTVTPTAYDSCIVGLSTNGSSVFVKGWATDWFPQHVKVYGQADNGPVIQTVLDIQTTLVTMESGIAKADWSMFIPLPHAGANTVKIWTENAAGNKSETAFKAYLVGTSFPQEESRAIPITTYIWKEMDLFGAVNKKGGMLSYVDAVRGEVPVSDVFTASSGSNKIRVYYPDETDNYDLEVVSAAQDDNGEYTVRTYNSGDNSYNLDGDSQFRLKLKRKYSGKSFITVIGAADAKEYKGYRLEYAPGENRINYDENCSGDCKSDQNSIFSNVIATSNSAVSGPIFQFMAAWDVSTPRLTGDCTLRTIIDDDWQGYNYEKSKTVFNDMNGIYKKDYSAELDRAHFSIGIPIDRSEDNTIKTIVADPYAKFRVIVPNGLISNSLDTVLAFVYSTNERPLKPLQNEAYDTVTPRYDFFPALKSGPDGNLKDMAEGTAPIEIEVLYTGEDLDLPGAAADTNMFGILKSDTRLWQKSREIVQDNLGIYREFDTLYGNVTITSRELLETYTVIPDNRMFANVRSVEGRYYVMAANSPPQFRYPPMPSPFIFNPDDVSAGNTITSIYYRPMATTSKYIYTNVRIIRQQGGAATEVRKLFNGIDTKTPVQLDFNPDTPVAYAIDENSDMKNHYFYNSKTDEPGVVQNVTPVVWDGYGNRLDGTYGIVEDGVYRAEVTIMDSFGNSKVSSCSIIKGRIRPMITQLGGKPVVDYSMSFDTDDEGEDLEVYGVANNPEGFGGYRIGYRNVSKTVQYGDESDEGYVFINMPSVPKYYGEDPTRSEIAVSPPGGKLAVWNITELNKEELDPELYDLRLFIYGTPKVEEGEYEDIVTEVIADRFTIHDINIRLAPGVSTPAAVPNPFSTNAQLSVNVVEAAGNTMTFSIINPDGVTIDGQMDGYRVEGTNRFTADLISISVTAGSTTQITGNIPLETDALYFLAAYSPGFVTKTALLRKVETDQYITVGISVENAEGAVLTAGSVIKGAASVTDCSATIIIPC